MRRDACACAPLPTHCATSRSVSPAGRSFALVTAASPAAYCSFDAACVGNCSSSSVASEGKLRSAGSSAFVNRKTSRSAQTPQANSISSDSTTSSASTPPSSSLSSTPETHTYTRAHDDANVHAPTQHAYNHHPTSTQSYWRVSLREHCQ